MEDARDEGDRRVLLGDKMGSILVLQRPILFQYTWVWIWTANACISMHLTIRTLDSELRKFLFALGIPKRSYYEVEAVTVFSVNLSILIDLRRLTGLVFVK